MALMNCPECSSQVSSIAVSCPHCGAPIASGGRSIGEPLTTVQETGKQLKIQIIFASLAFWFGVIGLFSELKSPLPSAGMTKTFSIVMCIGLAWYIATKARIWWHHK